MTAAGLMSDHAIRTEAAKREGQLLAAHRAGRTAAAQAHTERLGELDAEIENRRYRAVEKEQAQANVEEIPELTATQHAALAHCQRIDATRAETNIRRTSRREHAAPAAPAEKPKNPFPFAPATKNLIDINAVVARSKYTNPAYWSPAYKTELAKWEGRA